MGKKVPAGATIHRQDFKSLDAFVNAVAKSDVDQYAQQGFAWPGGQVPRNASEKAYALGREGWTEQLPAAMTNAKAAITNVEANHEMPTFVPVFDVSGADVDMGRYMSGEPECMVDYPLTQVVKAGRVITLCASMSISGAVSPDSVIRQGQAVVALALALSELGYALEIYQDLTGDAHGAFSVTRVLVKSAHDVLDAERIMFALAHPAMLRVFTFAALMMFPAGSGCNTTWQTPFDPIEDLAEGTIYLPSIYSDKDVPDADVLLEKWLRQLEIITD